MIDLNRFAGQWQLSRVIEDHRAGTTLRFTGIARFDAVDPADMTALDYAETGEMVLPDGARLKASRRYCWRLIDGVIEVLFDDGRPFHIVPTGSAPSAHHDCPPDSYDVAYAFADWPDWEATWRVRGPRKDYTMRSRYRRDTA
ncbi:MAG: DUF6314 family protein [Pseudomonadota bacterium]